MIFYFSSQPNLKSDLPSMWDFIFRKIAHISEFFVLSFFICNALREYRPRLHVATFIVFISSILYAGFDEFHQTLTMGRNGNIYDVGIDGIGVIAYIILLYVYREKYFV